MKLLLHLPVVLTTRLQELLTRPDADRGDNPVSSTVIIAGLVGLAIFIVTAIFLFGQTVMERVDPDLVPPAP